MSFLLKIVEGPNKGAEIALVEGVSVTLGKGDDCDVILADPTLPDDPATVAAAPDGVTFDGSPLAPFQVVTRGATSFAVGPSDQPWGELKWGNEEPAAENAADNGASHDSSPAPTAAPASPEPSGADEAPAEKKSRRGCLGCLVALVVLLVMLALLAFFLRDRPQGEKVWAWTTNTVSGVCERRLVASERDGAGANAALTLSGVVERHALATTNRNSREVLVGDFATRAERLVATAEAYAAKPGVELDFCDDETLKTAAEDTLAMLSEKELRVVAATNRVVALSGRARRIRRAIEALSADLPKLRNVDVSDVTLVDGALGAAAGVDGRETTDDGRDAAPASHVSRLAARASASAKPALPVCGILTTPYPCLVLRSGARVLEGASVGDSVVVKIEADAVTVTNATGRFVWKP